MPARTSASPCGGGRLASERQVLWPPSRSQHATRDSLPPQLLEAGGREMTPALPPQPVSAQAGAPAAGVRTSGRRRSRGRRGRRSRGSSGRRACERREQGRANADRHGLATELERAELGRGPLRCRYREEPSGSRGRREKNGEGERERVK